MKEISITGRGLTTMCRLCLSRGVAMLDVFRFSTRFEDKVVDVIMKCAPVQVLRYDEMPKFVCRLCLTQLEKMRQFQMQIIQSDKTLRRYLQQLHASDKEPLIEASIQSSNDSLIVNTNADIKYDSSELHDVFDLNVNWREKECENFNSESKNNDEMSLKYEIKVEQIDESAITLPDCADDPLEILSKGDEFNDINIGERKMETTLTINSTCKNIEIKPEIKNEPIDDELLINTENVSSNNYDSEINNENMNFDIDHISGNYSCNTCNKCFVNSDDLKNHMCTDTGEKMIQCEICNRFISGYENFIKHKRIHTDAKPYQCDICDKCFAQKAHLIHHKRTHTGEKPYQCNLCKKSFATNSNLRYHKRTHSGEKPYQCDFCDKCFTQASGLSKHKLSHAVEKPNEYSAINVGECKAEAPANFESETKTIEEIYLKSEIKDSSIYDNESLIQTESIVDTQITRLNDCGSEIKNDDIYIDFHRTSGNSACVRSTCIEHSNENCEDNETPVTLSQSLAKQSFSCKICDKYFVNSNDLKSHVCSDTGEKPFQCEICNNFFAVYEHLINHKRIHTNGKPYQCNICNKCLSSSSTLYKHKLTHTGEKSHQCDICNKCFTFADSLKKHKRVHTGEKPYQCDICNKCFALTGSLRKHKRVHTGEKPYNCDICNKCFALSGCLKKHKRVHTGEKPYQCDICNKCFAIADSLKKHKRVHTGEKPYQCDICSKCFALPDSWRKHKHVHTGEKPYQCDTCMKCFAHSSQLRKHKLSHTGEKRIEHSDIDVGESKVEAPANFNSETKCSLKSEIKNTLRYDNTHTGENPYQCDICNKCFARADSWKKHQRVHTGEKPYQCDMCIKSFSQSNDLIKHKRTHSVEKPYRCDMCDRCFTQLGNLDRHKRRHTGDRRYQCRICNKSFIESYSLKVHMRLHTGEKPYQCDVCDKCFTHAASLSKHKLSHAGEKPNEYSDIDVGETKVEAPANFELETKSIDETNLKVEVKDTPIYDN